MVEREPPIKYGKVTSFDAELRDKDRAVEHLMGLSEKYSRELRLLNATVVNARRLQAKMRKAFARGRKLSKTWTLGTIGELIASLEDDIRCATNAIEHGLPDLAARIASGATPEEKPKICRTKANAANRRVAIFEALVEPMTYRQLKDRLPFSAPVIRNDVNDMVDKGLVVFTKQTFTTGLGGVPPRVYRRAVTAQIEARA